MIKGYCIICSDHFESSSNIAATPCGHTFHDVCLFRWLTQRSSSTNCPKCRFKLKRNDCIQKLYFDVSADQSFEHDEYEDCFALKNKIADLEITLRNRDVEIKKLVQNETSNKVELKLVNDYTCELQEANCDLESKLKFQLMKVKTMSKELSAHAKLRKEYEELKVEITLYKHIKSAVSSSCEDIDLMFKSFSTKNGLKDQAIICTMMKRELMNMKERNKEMKEKYSEISQKNISLLKENDYLKVASDTLKEDFEYNQRERLYLEKKLNALESCSQNNNKILIESPAAHCNLGKTEDSILTQPTPSPVNRFKIMPVFCSTSDNVWKQKIENENLPLGFGKYELFKKRKKPATKENSYSSASLTELEKNEPLTPGISHVFDGFGSRRRYIDSPTKSLCKKFDKNKHIIRYKRKKK